MFSGRKSIASEAAGTDPDVFGGHMGKALFWKCQIWGWAAFVILSIPAKMIVFGSLSASVVSLYRDGIGFLLTWGMHEIYRKISYRRVPVLCVIFLILALSFLGSGIEMLLSQALHRVVFFEEAGFSNDTVATGVFYYRAALFACWSFLYFGVRLVYETMEKDGRLAHAVADHRETELQMLRAQMNPHLLVNALTSILARVGQQRPKVAAMVQALANYLNYSLIHQKDDFVTMDEEYEALMDFVTLENELFGKKLDIGCQIDEAARSLKVPGVILQPLVENAVKYGFRTWAPPIGVRLSISRSESDLSIEVANTGHWVSPDKTRTLGGVGLQNLRRRLRWLYGDKHKIEILEEAGWVTIRILLPVK